MNSTYWEKYNSSVSVAVRNLLRAAKTHTQVASALPDFVEATSQLPISRLEYWEGVIRSESGLLTQRSRFLGLTLFQARRHRSLIPWLDCCSYDGYQREKALQALGEGAPNSFLFAILLRRLNDWVPEVRAAARDRIPTIAENTHPKYILEALCGILPHINTWGRSQTESTKVLIDLLGIHDIPLRLSEKLISMTAGPAPSILGQAGRHPAVDSFLPRISKTAIQPAVRAKAYKSQLDGFATWFDGYQPVQTDRYQRKGQFKPVINKRKICIDRSFVEVLAAAANDRSPLVRRVAGNALFYEPGPLSANLLPIAKLLAKDASPSVAERGQFALKRKA